MGALDERVTLVTGAGSGIGRACALRLAAAGAAVLVNDLSSRRAEGVAAEIADAGGRAASSAGDVSSVADAERIVATANDELGGIDVLVNNAGLTRDALLHRMSDEDWSSVHDVVLGGAFAMTRAAAGALRRPATHHRKVIFMSSSTGLHGAPGTTNYSAAKAGLVGLAKSLALEWARFHINVNVVAPGLIAGTRLTEAKPAELVEAVASHVPIGRAGTPDDVAAAVVFLASPDADYITGQVLEIHGGLEVLA